MLDTSKPLELHNGETENIIEEYRRRISQALENEKGKLMERAALESKAIVAAARHEAQQIVQDARVRTQDQSSGILAEAQQKADQIIKDASRMAEEEARGKTRREVERILTRSREEADKAVNRAVEAAKKEADNLVGKARKESAQSIEDARASIEKEAKKESLRIIAEAEQIARQIVDNAKEQGIRHGREQLNAVLANTRQRLTGEINQLLNETIQTVDRVIEEARLDDEAEPQDVNTESENIVAALAVPIDVQARDSSETPDDLIKREPLEDGVEDALYQGVLNLEVIHPVQFSQLLNLQKCLIQAGVHLISAGGSADRNTTKTEYTIEVTSPQPMLKILKQMPPVDSVVPKKKKNIAVTLKHIPGR